MKRMLWLIPALLLLSAAPSAQENGSEDEGNPFADRPPGELRQRLADFPEIFDQDWYEVEVIIFAREDPVTDEYWRLDREPDLATNTIHLAPTDSDQPEMPSEGYELYADALDNGAWRTLDADTHELADAADRMLDRGGYRILFHESWRQPITQRNRSFPIYVQGGERIMPPLDDSFREPEPAPATSDETNGEDAGTNEDNETQPLAGHTLALPEMRGTLLLHVSRYLHVQPDLWFTDTDARGQPYHVQIDQARRMRSEELHYLDHPKFGLLIQIDPFKTEEQKEMEKIEEALEEQMER